MKHKLFRKYCKCGCKQIVNLGRHFIIGHQRKNKTPWNKGIPRSQETKDKLSQKLTGRKHSEESKRKIGESSSLRLKGHIVSKETRDRISKTLRSQHLKGYWTGRKRPKETCEKITKARRGTHLSQETKNKISIANKGRKKSIKERKKLSKSIKKLYKEKPELKLIRSKTFSNHWAKNIDRITGKNNPAWKGGSSFEPYSSEFSKSLKDKIKERDHHNCLHPFCKRKCKRLGIHHTDYNKKNSENCNLLTLCFSCNARVNSKRDFNKKLLGIIAKLQEYGEWPRTLNRRSIVLKQKPTNRKIGYD